MKKKSLAPTRRPCFLGFCPICGKTIFDQETCKIQAIDDEAYNNHGVCEGCSDVHDACAKYDDENKDCLCNKYDIVRGFQTKIIELEIELERKCHDKIF